jgi:hypothetical protein
MPTRQEAAQRRRRRGSDRSQEGSRSLEFLPSNVAALWEALPESFRAADATGSLPIHAAVDAAARVPEEHGGSMEIAKSLAELEPDSLLLPNADGDLPLHIAIIRNCRHNNGSSPDLAHFLLMRCQQAARVKRHEGNLAIHDAIQQRMFGLVREIVRRAPETARSVGAGGNSPLHVAAALPLRNSPSCPRIRRDYQYTELGLVNRLIESSPGSLWVRGRNGDLPLHVAIVRCYGSAAAVALVAMLLDHCPRSVDEADAGGNLPLHLAVAKSSPSLALVRLLVERWLGSLEEKDASGSLPLHLAAANQTAPLDVIY